ncbi:nucleotide exchange factor GrpE [Chloroflexota bacterium]
MIQQEPEEDQVEVIEEDIGTLKQALTEEREKSENYLANWQRVEADFINYKQRSEQEKGEIGRFARSALMLSLLPVLDDLERAFASLPADLAEVSWLEGIRLIERKLRASLEEQGLSLIKAAGEPFDPHFHEAIRQDRGREGIVIEEVQRGYKFHDMVIRPSRVVVGNGEAEDEEEIEQENNSQEN